MRFGAQLFTSNITACAGPSSEYTISVGWIITTLFVTFSRFMMVRKNAVSSGDEL
jgi:hypothetical protein